MKSKMVKNTSRSNSAGYIDSPYHQQRESWARCQFELLCQFRAVFWLAAYAKAFRMPVASRAASFEINESGRDNRSAGHFYCQLSNVLVLEVTAAWPDDEPDFFVPHVLENHLFSPCKSRLRRYAAEPVHREGRPAIKRPVAPHVSRSATSCIPMPFACNIRSLAAGNDFFICNSQCEPSRQLEYP